MANNVNNLRNLADQLVGAVQSSGAPDPTFVQRLLTLPREIFDYLVGKLSMKDQAQLASSFPELYAYVRPVMDGFTWIDPPLPLPEMMSGDSMAFQYVKMAENAASATERVACPWCSIIHSPLYCLDEDSGFECAKQIHPAYPPVGWVSDLLGMDYRPRPWHPLILYAFSIYKLRGWDTSVLEEKAQLDFYLEEWNRAGTFVLDKFQWKVTWHEEKGLFVRGRLSELIHPEEDGVYDNDSSCGPCASLRTYYDVGELNQGNFQVWTIGVETKWIYLVGDIQPVQTQMLRNEDRLTNELMVGPVHGCPNCGIDCQFAWQDCEIEEQTAHWLHRTKWFLVGKDIDIKSIHDTMKANQGHWHDHLRAPNLGDPSLGIGEYARLCGLPLDDF